MADLERSWPRLDPTARARLDEALELSRPDSVWLPRIAALGG